MIYRKRSYKIKPSKYESFNNYFHTFLLPNQIKNGAKLVGRWSNQLKNKIEAIWEYKDIDDYYYIESKVKNDPYYDLAQKNKFLIEGAILEKKEEFLDSTGQYFDNKYSLAVSALIKNEANEILLVKTNWRSDTYELPGGVVDSGESLEKACIRELKEETGVEAKLHGITGIYMNETKKHIVFVFTGHYLSGELTACPEEISDCGFFFINKQNVGMYVTRGNFQSRILDALSFSPVPFESFEVRPYKIMSRVEEE